MQAEDGFIKFATRLYKAIKQAPGGEKVKLGAVQFDVVTALDGLTVVSAKVRVKTSSKRGATWETATRVRAEVAVDVCLGHRPYALADGQRQIRGRQRGPSPGRWAADRVGQCASGVPLAGLRGHCAR